MPYYVDLIVAAVLFGALVVGLRVSALAKERERKRAASPLGRLETAMRHADHVFARAFTGAPAIRDCPLCGEGWYFNRHRAEGR